MSANTTALTPEQREAIYHAWIAALRSGQYKQGRSYLESDGKFCCLGVLCHVLHQRPELGIKMDRLVIPGEATEYSTPTSPGCRARVPGIASELGLPTTMPSAVHRAVESVLIDLNDAEGASFAEIAQFIEGAVMPLLRTNGILPPAQQEAPEKDHETHENTTDAPLMMEEREQRDEARVMADKLTTELAACDVARPSTPVGWSDTDWIKHLQDQEPHPLAGLHINQGSMNAAADAYEAEYNAAQEARRAEHDAARKEGCMTEDRDEALLRQALEALSRARQTAMEQTLKARLPECAEFAGIAQDLDFVVAALRERLGVKEQA